MTRTGSANDADVSKIARASSRARSARIGWWTVGQFNKYANNPKTDFLNWTAIMPALRLRRRWLGLQLRRCRRMVYGPLDAAPRYLRSVDDAGR